jgi:hypothetical protein
MPGYFAAMIGLPPSPLSPVSVVTPAAIIAGIRPRLMMFVRHSGRISSVSQFPFASFCLVRGRGQDVLPAQASQFRCPQAGEDGSHEQI